jgi:hypothetical protein
VSFTDRSDSDQWQSSGQNITPTIIHDKPCPFVTPAKAVVRGGPGCRIEAGMTTVNLFTYRRNRPQHVPKLDSVEQINDLQRIGQAVDVKEINHRDLSPISAVASEGPHLWGRFFYNAGC